jgi:single-strand DNA-binding protein
VVVKMAADNTVTIVGNLTDDPELKYTPNGAAVANFSVAVSRRTKDEATGQWVDADTSFLRVNVWRTLAENAAESLTRGTRVIVTGRVRQRSWETPDGDKRSVVEIEAEEIGPSLKWATAKVEKTSKSGGGSGGGDWSGRASGGPEQEETPLDGR